MTRRCPSILPLCLWSKQNNFQACSRHSEERSDSPFFERFPFFQKELNGTERNEKWARIQVITSSSFSTHHFAPFHAIPKIQRRKQVGQHTKSKKRHTHPFISLSNLPPINPLLYKLKLILLFYWTKNRQYFSRGSCIKITNATCCLHRMGGVSHNSSCAQRGKECLKKTHQIKLQLP